MPWRTLAPVAVLIVAGWAAPAAAQDTPGDGAGTAEAAPQVDVSKLPLNMARVQRRLRETIEREQRGATIRYTVDVFGEAPPLVVFPPDAKLRFGPVPRSAPTHQDMMNIMTPQEFRAPAMDLGNLLKWIQNRSSTDTK